MEVNTQEEIAQANLLDNECIELVFLRENITLDIDEVVQGWKKAREIAPDKNKKILLKTGKWTLLENKAQAYVKNELKTWLAVAIVVDNLGQKIMGNFIINMTNKNNSIKLFNDETLAKEWLKSIG